MVRRLLPTSGVEQADAADALACAIAHAHLAGTRARMIVAQVQSGKVRSGVRPDCAPIKESLP
jgi:hypothetical protein